MILKPMYPGIAYSPPTELTKPLSATDTVIQVADASDNILPPAPNKAVIEHGSLRETISYGGKTDNSLTLVTRATAQGDTPRDWPAGAAVVRVYTAGDQQAFIDNINYLENTKASTNDLNTATAGIVPETAMNTAISAAVTGLASQEELDSEAAALTQNIAQRMAHAPVDGRVYGGIGPNWHALEGTEERAVITVSHPAQVTLAPGSYRIDNWDAFEVITIEHNGAQVNYFKGFSQSELYAMGENSMLYKFTFDPSTHTVAVEESALSGGTNPNILHNWDFRNPVNQRGLAVYVNDTATIAYTIDRWFARRGTLSVQPNFVRLTKSSAAMSPQILQRLEFSSLYAGMIATISVMINNQVFFNTITLPTSNSSGSTLVQLCDLLIAGAWRNTNGSIDVFISMADGALQNTSVDIQAVKFEMGTSSTLTNDPQMDFGKELAICQRFYEKSYSINIPPGSVSIAGRELARTNNQVLNHLEIFFPYRVAKRANPALSIFSIDGTPGAVSGMLNTVTTGVREDEPMYISASSSDRIGGVRINPTSGNYFAYSFQWVASVDL